MAPMVGGVIGAVVVLGLFGAVMVFMRRRKRAIMSRETGTDFRGVPPSTFIDDSRVNSLRSSSFVSAPNFHDTSSYAPSSSFAAGSVDLESQRQSTAESFMTAQSVMTTDSILIRDSVVTSSSGTETPARGHLPSPSVSSIASDSTARVKRVPVPLLVDFNSNPFSDDANIATSLNPFSDPEPQPAAATEPSRLSTASSLMPPAQTLAPPAKGSRLSTTSSLGTVNYVPSEAGTVSNPSAC